MMTQKIIMADNGYGQLLDYVRSLDCRKVMIVHGRSMSNLEIGRKLLALPDLLGIELVEFTDFAPNPQIESAVKGANICREHRCEAIIACGGGSAMDVAKCIRLFVEIDTTGTDFLAHLQPGRLPFIAIPTTAGTGSEATHFAVVYKDGQKLSVAEKGNIPQAVVFDAAVLNKLPMRQKRATFFDALCHAIESYWSMNATSESKFYAREAMKMLLSAEPQYLSSNVTLAENMVMLMAANYAGRAINISKTTAAHAMCYKLTSVLGLPHGQAAVLCLTCLWPLMVDKIKMLRGEQRKALEKVMGEISMAMGEDTIEGGIVKLKKLVVRHDMLLSKAARNDKVVISDLVNSVNIERLQNHPLKLTSMDFYDVYQKIIAG